MMRVNYRHFENSIKSWETLFAEAAAFATEIGCDRLISISHSHGGGTDMFGSGGVSVITVW